MQVFYEMWGKLTRAYGHVFLALDTRKILIILSVHVDSAKNKP